VGKQKLGTFANSKWVSLAEAHREDWQVVGDVTGKQTAAKQKKTLESRCFI
jgi:hypothetical protein